MESDGPFPIDHEAARRALDAAGATVACSSCGEARWRNFGEVGAATVFLTGVGPDNKPIAMGGFQAGLRAFAFICANCGFIRLHEIDELADRLTESTERQDEDS